RPGLTFRPELHPLEDRTVLDGTVTLNVNTGLLTITGTAGNDTVRVWQTAGPGSERVNVTLNGQPFDFKASQVNKIQANLLAGNDTITLDESVRPVTPSSTFDTDGGTDALIFKGTAGADAITVTGTTVALTGAGLLTYSGFESLLVDCLDGNDTVSMTGINTPTVTTVAGGAGSDTFSGNFGTFGGNLTLTNFETASVTIGTLSGQLTVSGGPLTNSNVTTVAASGLLAVTEDLPALNAGLLSNSTFSTISGN